MEKLSSGVHLLTLSAFDNLNNQAESEISFKIATTSSLAIDEVVNYPNPFRRNTDFTFQTNRDGADVTVRIYTISGRLIQELDGYYTITGYNQIPWDGRDRDGDTLANGVYLYKVILRMDDEKVQAIEKMVVIN
jgi:flagellar hook assembly protein FlgD